MQVLKSNLILSEQVSSRKGGEVQMTEALP